LQRRTLQRWILQRWIPRQWLSRWFAPQEFDSTLLAARRWVPGAGGPAL